MSSLFKKALDVAKKHHAWQSRKDGTPYIQHPINVANKLKEHDFPEEALVAAILHDICEDTDISNLKINELFWSRVWFIIHALSKNKKPCNNSELKKEYLEKKDQKKNLISALQRPFRDKKKLNR